jgi:hypothetical protein
MPMTPSTCIPLPFTRGAGSAVGVDEPGMTGSLVAEYNCQKTTVTTTREETYWKHHHQPTLEQQHHQPSAYVTTTGAATTETTITWRPLRFNLVVGPVQEVTVSWKTYFPVLSRTLRKRAAVVVVIAIEIVIAKEIEIVANNIMVIIAAAVGTMDEDEVAANALAVEVDRRVEVDEGVPPRTLNEEDVGRPRRTTTTTTPTTTTTTIDSDNTIIGPNPRTGAPNRQRLIEMSKKAVNGPFGW